MGKVTANITMSLDGFITGPNVSVGNGLGDNGERLHDWMFAAKTADDAAIVTELYASTGAVILGKGMFDVGFEPWGDPPPFRMPVFVVTHEKRNPLPMQGGTTYYFIADGIDAALQQARVAASERNVGIWGGADIIRQYLEAGMIDELHIHVAPLLLGAGIRLFEHVDAAGIGLEKIHAIDTPGATHLRFRVSKTRAAVS